MALASIAVPPDPKRDAKAAELVPFVGTWPRYTLKVAWGAFEAGTVFRRAPSSKDDRTRYLVNAVACSCLDYQEAGYICKHVRAYALWEQQECEALSLASDAEVDAVCAGIEADAQARERAISRYSALYPACAVAGCDDAPLKNGRCLGHQRATVAA